MINIFPNADEVSDEAKKAWCDENHNSSDDWLFNSFELGWFRAAYSGIYNGMNRVLSELDAKNREINLLKLQLHEYENESN
mgnify:CR=1 FL=1